MAGGKTSSVRHRRNNGICCSFAHCFNPLSSGLRSNNNLRVCLSKSVSTHSYAPCPTPFSLSIQSVFPLIQIIKNPLPVFINLQLSDTQQKSRKRGRKIWKVKQKEKGTDTEQKRNRQERNYSEGCTL